MSRFWGPSSETTEKVGGVSQVFPWSFTPSSNNCLTFLRVRQSCCNKMVWFKKSWISWFDTGHNTYFLKTVSMNMSIFEISKKSLFPDYIKGCLFYLLRYLLAPHIYRISQICFAAGCFWKYNFSKCRLHIVFLFSVIRIRISYL